MPVIAGSPRPLTATTTASLLLSTKFQRGGPPRPCPSNPQRANARRPPRTGRSPAGRQNTRPCKHPPARGLTPWTKSSRPVRLTARPWKVTVGRLRSWLERRPGVTAPKKDLCTQSLNTRLACPPVPLRLLKPLHRRTRLANVVRRCLSPCLTVGRVALPVTCPSSSASAQPSQREVFPPKEWKPSTEAVASA